MTSVPWCESSLHESEEDSVNQESGFVNMPGIPFPPPTLGPPPIQIGPPNGGGPGSMLTSPLPTALFPLPLDPLCPPAVLPLFHNPTNQSSGYSTAGHSRSSSPQGGLSHPESSTSRNPSPSSTPGGGGSNHYSPSPNVVFEAPSTEITILSHFPTVPGQFVVYFHINPGVNVSFNVGDHVQVIKGPMTVPLVSTSSNPPIPLPMQVPPGHVVQQIVDESGTLRHVIVSHQPPLIPIPSYGPSGSNSPYFSPGPGYPPFGPIQSPYSNQSGTPPPGVGVYGVPPVMKDERTQRQFLKLRRKFDQKQPPNHYQNGTYPRKDVVYNNNNNGRRVVLSNGGSKTEEEGSVGSTGSVTSQGTQDEEEETRLQSMAEMLSNILPPTVSDVTCRSAFIKWSIPERWTETGENKYMEFDISDNDFRYEVFISDRSRPDSGFKSIFIGTALSCRVKDLKPATSYAISYCAMINEMKGSSCSPSLFTTLAAEPDPPQSPRAVTRHRNSLMFKWNAPNDNGSKIVGYLLEFDEGKGGSHFVEAYKGKNKQCTVAKLQPAYSYQFRLAAFNEIGMSRFSPTTTVMTAGNPPSQPEPPTLTEAGVTYLTLEWKSRPTDDEYSLQMEDPTSGHGYLGAYNGNAPHCTCIGLKRYTEYKFRVKAYNAEGHSKWSDEVIYRTLPDRPFPPHKPSLKGKTHANNFKVKWDPPVDNGGIGVSCYVLEIDQGNGRFEEIYRGVETEYLVESLSPGQSYPLRVRAIGPGGESDSSEPSVITTEPVCPGKSHIPRIVGKPKSNSVHLKWSSPDWDGGSPVTCFEVGCTTPDNITQEAYRGKETSCFVTGLLPGRSYLFQVRAYNRIAPGGWSDPLEVISGPGSPDTPSQPIVTNKSSHSILVHWNEPLNNGSAVSEYKLQMATLQSNSQNEDEEGEENQQDNASTFTQVYSGPLTQAEIKQLQPSIAYLFRLQAQNGAGVSDWSGVTTHVMPASSPNAVTGLEAVSTSSSISLSWSVPQDNGSPITHYNLLLGDTIVQSTENHFTLDNLMPDTHYKIRVQAVNSVGPGGFCSILKISTKPLPPLAPKLEVGGVAHYWIKLKWNGETGGGNPVSGNKGVEYVVQMINPFQNEFQVVYRGNANNTKVNKLNEDTEYQFRICGINPAGQGLFSDVLKISTLKAPPNQVKGLKVSGNKEEEVRHFGWVELNSSGGITYQLQIAKKKDQDFKNVYRGQIRRFEMNYDELDRGFDYVSRVCGIRVLDDGSEIFGPYSSSVSFWNPVQTPISNPQLSKINSSSFTSNLSNTAQVLEERLGRISYESRIGITAVVSLILLGLILSLILNSAFSS